jgi:hypothetical protein
LVLARHLVGVGGLDEGLVVDVGFASDLLVELVVGLGGVPRVVVPVRFGLGACCGVGVAREDFGQWVIDNIH